ncbi:MAG: hypothetical protein K2I40_04720, partial [Bifidobacterium castoris]|nr:hypothetical protein [Bifidobacterium castoris]
MPRKRATGAARPYPYRQKRKDGTYVERWKVELSLGKGPDGRYRTKQITASTFKECQRKLKEARELLNRTGDVTVHEDALLTDYVAMFLDSAHRRVSPGSMQNYRTEARRIGDVFAGVRVRDVRASMVRSYLESRAAVSPSMEGVARCVLGQALDLAVADDVIMANPLHSVRRVRRHGDVETKRRAFSVPELQMMLANASKMPLPTATRMWWRMLTGMRQGEIIGAVTDELHIDT